MIYLWSRRKTRKWKLKKKMMGTRVLGSRKRPEVGLDIKFLWITLTSRGVSLHETYTCRRFGEHALVLCYHFHFLLLIDLSNHSTVWVCHSLLHLTVNDPYSPRHSPLPSPSFIVSSLPLCFRLTQHVMVRTKARKFDNYIMVPVVESLLWQSKRPFRQSRLLERCPFLSIILPQRRPRIPCQWIFMQPE